MKHHSFCEAPIAKFFLFALLFGWRKGGGRKTNQRRSLFASRPSPPLFGQTPFCFFFFFFFCVWWVAVGNPSAASEAPFAQFEFPSMHFFWGARDIWNRGRDVAVAAGSLTVASQTKRARGKKRGNWEILSQYCARSTTLSAKQGMCCNQKKLLFFSFCPFLLAGDRLGSQQATDTPSTRF